MNKELLGLKNVGKATLKDLEVLGITTVAQLRGQDPDRLFADLQRVTGCKHDICVRDVLAAIIHEAETGEKLAWWHWSRLRKGKAGGLGPFPPKSLTDHEQKPCLAPPFEA